MVVVNAIVFVFFLAVVVFGAARLGWAAASAWFRSNERKIHRLVDDALGERE